MTALTPCLDEWALTTLNALAEHYARQYGDTGIVTAQRQAALLAEDAAQDTRPAANRAAWQRRQAATANTTRPPHYALTTDPKGTP